MEYTRPYLYPKQEQAFFHKFRYELCEASTKSGKTVAAIAWILEQAFGGKSGNDYWWVAPVSTQAEIAYRRIKSNLTVGSFTSKDAPTPIISLINGARISFKSADNPDSLFGEDVYAAVIDEASRCKEESWHALRSTITATQGPVRIIGNVKGRRNWFYNLARLAEAEGASANMHYSKITVLDAIKAGVIPQSEVEDARRTLPESVFRELYMAEPSDDAGNPFGPKHIQACIAGLSSDTPVAFGLDLAKKNDYLVLIGLDTNGSTCSFDRWKEIPWRQSIRRIHDIVGEDVPCLVDSTGIGDPILEELQYEHGNFSGYNFSLISKQRLMEGLAVSIQSHEIRFPEGPIVQELNSFEYEFTRSGVRYCLDQDTPVLTNDLRWVPVGSLERGDKLVAFDEEPKEDRKTRCWREAEVTDTGIVKRPSYKIRLDDGTEFICSAEHKWLVSNAAFHKLRWKTTNELKTIDNLIRVCDFWKAETSYSAGYLAGILDGEGSLSHQNRNDHDGYSTRIAFSQRDNEAAYFARICMMQFDFEWTETPGGGTNEDVIGFGLTGKTHSILRMLGQIRPKRLLANLDINKLGTMWAQKHVRIDSIEQLGERAVIALGTSTETLVAKGFASHNTAPEGLHDDCVCSLALAREQWSTTAPGQSMMTYYASRAKEIQKELKSETNNESKLLDREMMTWISSSPSREEVTTNELTELYQSTLAQYQPELTHCFRCGAKLGLTRVSDGINSWHPECKVH